MSSRHPKHGLRGLLLALAILLTGLGPPDTSPWAPETPSSRDPGPELWHWFLLLASGGWLLGYVGGRLVGEADSTRSPLHPGCESPPSVLPSEPLVDPARLSLEQLYRELRRVNRAALARARPDGPRPART